MATLTADPVLKVLSLTALGAVLTILGNTGSAKAATLEFEGTLFDGSLETGVATAGDNASNPDGWDFWQFFGNAGDVATVTVNRLVGALDPVLGVWFGSEADTSDYINIFLDGATTPLVIAADDELPPAIPGPFGDPQATFTLTDTGFYTIAVSSYISDPSTEPLAYSISLVGSGGDMPISVPEPLSLLSLLAVSAVGVGSTLKRQA